MNFIPDVFRTNLHGTRALSRLSWRRVRTLSIIVFASLFCTVTAARQTASTPAASVPAAAPEVPPDPAWLCNNGKAGADTLKAVNDFSSTIPRIRLASRSRFLPLDSSTEILAFVDPETIKSASFRMLVVAAGANLNDVARAINSERVSARAATKADFDSYFKGVEETPAKTVIRFTPQFPAEDMSIWKSAQVYVIGCEGGVAKQFGQLDTNISDQDYCRWLAIAIVAAFYILAALATFFIHRSERIYKTKDDIKKHGVNGTNYASFVHHLNPVVLAAGGNGRGSATKLQILFFSLVVFGLVSYIWMSTGYLSNLSETVLLLMGISGIGATASAATDVAKTRLEFANWAWLINRRWLPKGGVAEINRAEWKDVVTTDGEFDVYRFQMITFSVLVGAALLGAGAEMGELSKFTIPQALLGILGLSQVVYVAGKLVAPPSVSQLNEQIVKLRAAESTLQSALTKQELSAAATGSTALPLYRDELAVRVGDAFEKYSEEWETTRTMFESTLSREVSAVAKGFKPPFPYLSPPADVLASLDAKFAELDKKLTPFETTLTAQLTGNVTVKAKLDAIKAAREAFEKALQFARDSLAEFAKQEADSADLEDGIMGEKANEKAKSKAKSEKAVRNALDLVRRRLDELNRLLPP